MKEPTKKQIKELQKIEDEITANLNIYSLQQLSELRKKIKADIENIKNAEKAQIYYKSIASFFAIKFLNIQRNYKSGLIETLNKVGKKQSEIIETIINKPVDYKIFKSIPTSPEFKYTNRVLSEKSMLRRSKLLANKVSEIISNGFNNGKSVLNIQKEIDIVLGFRNKEGAITTEARALLRAGKGAHTNGLFYSNYRIARTEVGRMARVQIYRVYEELEENNKRLKYIGTSDKRSRPNSIQMNGQISDKEGRFIYPDGNKYKMFEAPAKYSILDRCTSTIVFI